LCFKKEKAKSKRLDRRRTSNEAGIDRTDPDFNHALLSPESVLIRIQKTVRKSRSLEKKVKRLELKIESTLHIQEDDTNVREVLEEVFTKCTKDDLEGLKKEII
jgi:hypothetical protein